jgi:hypothetical protein
MALVPDPKLLAVPATARHRLRPTKLPSIDPNRRPRPRYLERLTWLFGAIRRETERRTPSV